jgi:hypothetical protein
MGEFDDFPPPPLEDGWLQKQFDRAAVMCAIDPYHLRPPAELDPKYWEPLRIKLQEIWRRSTGEQHAILHVENQP